MYIGGEVYDVGTVGHADSSHTTVIMGIVLGIVGALAAGAGLAFIAMHHLRKKKKGEGILIRPEIYAPLTSSLL